MSGVPLAVGIDAPFPWFGGKRRVADLVWEALGDCPGYVEPFAGSLAVLLRRPHEPKVETVNDKDAYVANFWRAVQHDPEAVARFADWPVNETDLLSRHLWLVNSGRERIAHLESDPEFYDAKVAGWWVWGVCAWIGSGWCSGSGPWKLPHLGDAGQGVNRKLPHLGDAGVGVNRQLPHLGDAGRGVNRQLPHLGDAGQGVNRKLPHLGDAGRGYQKTTDQLVAWMQGLANRLRKTRVCAGDWRRVLTNSVLRGGGYPCGIFLDPPYDTGSENYSTTEAGIAGQVAAWARENGENPNLRIVLAGYDGEYEMPDSWRVHAYSATGAYIAKGTKAATNRHRERLWFSPACLSPMQTVLSESEL